MTALGSIDKQNLRILSIAVGLLFAFGTHAVLAQPPLTNEITTPLYSSNRSVIQPIPNRASHAYSSGPRVETIDAETRWQFVTRESIVVESSIIRLRDVIRPLQPDLTSWKRLAESTIGLMPADGGDAKISRDRLADLIARAEATPERIKIFGPETIVVRRSTQRHPVLANGSAPNSTVTDASDSPTNTMNAVYQEPLHEQFNNDDHTPSIDPDVLERMQTYVIAMLRNEQRELYEGFEIHVAFDQTSVESLSKIQGIRQLAFLDEVPLWSHHSPEPRTARIRIHGRAIDEDCQGTATLTLKPFPGIVTTRDSMRRGQVVHEGDLQYQPYSGNAGSLPVDVVADPSDIVGQEVTGLVRGGAALSLSAFAPPRVIRRGDLLEVAVGGGGVRVTTGAKAMADGAMGELIEIETLSPKRRLLAKVVDSSLVEILTQPTQVRAIPPNLNSGIDR